MLVAIVHYHLRPGGVTRVIERAVSSLAEHDVKVVILTGEQPDPDFKLINLVRVVKGLGYPSTSSKCSAHELVKQLMMEARSSFGTIPDIWHFHNHSLGKNCALTEAVRLLSLEGHKMLLQIHDFAEDGRPNLFRTIVRQIGNGNVSELSDHVYPQASHIHYATLNSRDRVLLADAGIPEPRLHLLPNPVTFADSSSEYPTNKFSDEGRLFLYCTRAIKRKNIGEFILWALLGDAHDRYAITLAPKNPDERPAYDRWVALARECNIPVEFELAVKCGKPFHVMLESAWATVTTSLAEGFGLAFLEPWLVQRPVLGRKLPEITNEFETAGIDLSLLYHRLLLPVSWLNKDALLKKTQTRLSVLLSAYGRDFQSGDDEKAINKAMDGDRIDFGYLDEEMQQKIIRKVAGSKFLKREFRPSNLAPACNVSSMVEHNQKVVKRVFSLNHYGLQLMDLYRQLETSEIEKTIKGLDMNKILDTFLSPERFCLLRS